MNVMRGLRFPGHARRLFFWQDVAQTPPNA